MLILGIETSCDDTAASVVREGREMLSGVISSQDRFHRKYGGVVPEIASRRHLETVNLIIDEALECAGCSFDDIDAIAVTQGPGLVGSLLIGIMTAKALAYVYSKPLVAVNHLEGHIFSSLIGRPELEPPFLSLIVSGGHSDLIWVNDYCDYEVMGRTRDDAAGEAFDKVAKYFNLGYPGGPVIDRMAKEGNPEAIIFPRAKMKDNRLDFSFSGIKTAVVNYVRNTSAAGKNRGIKQKKGKPEVIEIKDKKLMADILASFQNTVVGMLLDNTLAAAEIKNTKTIVIGGGVAANSCLRRKFREAAEKEGLKLYYPEISLCTDNAAMIACAGYYRIKKRKPGQCLALTARANLPVT